jgi:hypothetical protein
MERKSKEYLELEESNKQTEIDLVDIIKVLRDGRNTIFKTTLIFICLSVFTVFFSPIEYSSTIVVKPILSNPDSKIGGSLGGLAAMAGINLGGSSASAEIHPTLYPKIVESYKFQKELMQTPIYVSELDKEVSFEQYYMNIYNPGILQHVKKYTIGLPSLIINSIKKESQIMNKEIGFDYVSAKDKILLYLLGKQLNITIDENDSFVSLTAIMPEKIQCAQLVNSAKNILQREVITHKLKKVNEDLEFIIGRFEEKKEDFENAQQNLAKYRDANKNVNTATAYTEMERLESEYQLAFSVYSELAKQVEKQKIQVKENTPVFTVLKEAVVPLEKHGQSTAMKLMLGAVFGVVMGVMLIFFKSFIKEFKSKIVSK